MEEMAVITDGLLDLILQYLFINIYMPWQNPIKRQYPNQEDISLSSSLYTYSSPIRTSKVICFVYPLFCYILFLCGGVINMYFIFYHRLKLTWIVNVYSCFLTIYTSGPFEMKSSISISALVVLAFALMSEAEEKEEGLGVRDAIQ